jgi:hypothetical protein
MSRVTFGDVGEVVVTLQHATVVEAEVLHRAVQTRRASTQTPVSFFSKDDVYLI